MAWGTSSCTGHKAYRDLIQSEDNLALIDPIHRRWIACGVLKSEMI